MLPDRVSNPGPLTYEWGVLPIALRGPKVVDKFRDMHNEYAKRLLWRGLNDTARHDSVKENDGPRIIRHWRYNMFEFFLEKPPEVFYIWT